MNETTTLRVRRSTRDRVTALGQLTHDSADAVIDKAVSLYEKELFWARWDEAHARATDEELAADVAEAAVWDRASTADCRSAQQDERAHG